MMIAAIVFLTCVVVFNCGLAFSPGHTFKGILASLTMLGILISGLVLAVNAL